MKLIFHTHNFYIIKLNYTILFYKTLAVSALLNNVFILFLLEFILKL